MANLTARERILRTVEDLVAHLLFYDRKEDEYLPLGEIEAAFDRGEITREDIVLTFAETLGLKGIQL